MKKILVIVALIAATCTAVNAENTTRIGSVHRFDYGIFMGYSQGETAWHGMGFIDLNAANSNFRTRLSFGIAERPFLGGHGFNPNAGLELQYLLRLADAFYLYPAVGGYFEHFSEQSGHSFVTNDFGLKAGAGIELQFSTGFGIFAEGTYMHMFKDPNKANRLGGRVGVVMHF